MYNYSNNPSQLTDNIKILKMKSEYMVGSGVNVKQNKMWWHKENIYSINWARNCSDSTTEHLESKLFWGPWSSRLLSPSTKPATCIKIFSPSTLKTVDNPATALHTALKSEALVVRTLNAQFWTTKGPHHWLEWDCCLHVRWHVWTSRTSSGQFVLNGKMTGRWVKRACEHLIIKLRMMV